MNAFRTTAEQRWGVTLPDYDALHAWSVDEPEKFWTSVWDDAEIIGTMGDHVLAEGQSMPGARWFPDARLNFAENILRRADDSDALVFWGEDQVKVRLSHSELRTAVARFAAGLRQRGVVKGDRVAAYMPNMPQTVIAMLAAASLGAIFTSASPDFGVQGVLDRFGQTEPKLLIACDGYFYDGKRVDCLNKLAAIAEAVPSWASRTRSARSGAHNGSTISSRGRPKPLGLRSRRCPSTTRCTSCIRRAPPGCRSALCTAPAGHYSSISRNTACTAT
jgi:acetoacetyl-CoA synthetase